MKWQRLRGRDVTESIVPLPDIALRRNPGASRVSRTILRALLSRARHGTLVVTDNVGTRHYGRGLPETRVTVRDSRAYRAILWRGSTGFGESYTRGWWDGDDLTLVVRFVIKNLSGFMRRLDALARWTAPVSRLRQRIERVDKDRDRSNVRAHYDLGNEFYSLMLDETMMYSCAYFDDPSSSLYDASIAKLERLCRKLDLRAADHVVEIGTGWGGFAVFAAERYGCRVTTVTISDAQFEHARALVNERGLSHLVEVRNEDYRDLSGAYDKLVSIEMIEAIGWRQLDTYFSTCAHLLKPDGIMGLQAITIDDFSYERAKNRDDFIKRMIFPGGFLPSLEAIVRSSSSVSDLRVVNVEDIGRHYAETLSRWRANLAAHGSRVRELGLGEEFHRMWHMYLGYCEAAFLERHISDVQLVLARRQWHTPMNAIAVG